MNTSIKKLEKSIVEITIEESNENIAKYRKIILDNIRKNINIKGFRKWANIPEEIIIKNYGEEKILTMVIDEALNKLYWEALKKNNIFPINQWYIKEIISQVPLIVVMIVEVFPEVEIDEEYKNIKLKKTLVSVNDSEVEDSLKEIQTKFTSFEKAYEWYLSKMWDRLYINTQWFDLLWNKLETTTMENYPLILWTNVLVPWFEEWLVNKKSGEKVELTIDFPKDYHNNDFAGKKTKFEIVINEIEFCNIPEFNPEFIKKLKWKDLDLEWFKKLIKDELFETKEMEARLEDENKLIFELLKISKVDFWDNLLKNNIDKIYAEIKTNITNSWAKPSDYLSSLWIDEETYIQQNVKPIAIKRLQAELILHKLKELEKVEVNLEETNKEIEKILARFGSSDVLDRLKELYKPGTKSYIELNNRMIYRKLIDMFFE